MSIKRIKLLARIQLKRAFFISISITSCYIFIDTLFGLYYNFISNRVTTWASLVMPLLISFLFSLVFNVLTVGIHRFFLLQAERKESGFSSLLFGIQNSPDRTIIYSLIQSIVTTLPLLPGGILLGLYYFQNCEQELFVALGILLGFIGFIVSYVLSLSFSQGLLLIADGSDENATTLCKRSFTMMKGHKERLFALQLGFVPLLLVSTLIFYIGFFLLIPYYFSSMSFFYLDLRKRIRPEMYFPE